MAINKSDALETLGDIFLAMSSYAGGSIPGVSSSQYTQWLTWVRLAQQDCARRGFWARLLTSEDVAITKDVDFIVLPDNFFKRNGIYVLNVNGEDWASKANKSGQKLMVTKRFSDGKWICRFVGYTPTSDATGKLWYFYNPPIPVEETDPIYLDGQMIVFGALKEYFRQARQPGSQDDARNEYENRFNEELSMDMLPTPQEMMEWQSVYKHTGLDPSLEVHRYGGGRRRV